MGKSTQQIIPDFIVETEDDGTISLTLNNKNVPELRLSKEFKELLEEHTINKDNQSKESYDAFMFLKQKVMPLSSVRKHCSIPCKPSFTYNMIFSWKEMIHF